MLEERRLAFRVHGGAMPANRSRGERSFEEVVAQRAAGRRRSLARPQCWCRRENPSWSTSAPPLPPSPPRSLPVPISPRSPSSPMASPSPWPAKRHTRAFPSWSRAGRAAQAAFVGRSVGRGDAADAQRRHRVPGLQRCARGGRRHQHQPARSRDQAKDDRRLAAMRRARRQSPSSTPGRSPRCARSATSTSSSPIRTPTRTTSRRSEHRASSSSSPDDDDDDAC